MTSTVRTRFAVLVAAAATLASGLSFATAQPAAAACASGQLVPVLKELMRGQGLPYSKLVRGKETLVRAYMTKPSCADSGNIIEITGGSLVVTSGTTTLTPTGGARPTPAPVTPYAALGAYTTSAPPADAAADLNFVVRLEHPTVVDAFDATFKLTVNYQTKTSRTATPVAGSKTFTTVEGSTAPIVSRVDKKTAALRVLIQPMGDPTRTTEWFSDADRAIVQEAMLTLNRMFPVPAGTSDLLSGTGGIRYEINTPGMIDITRFLSGGLWCGTDTNFSAIKSELAQKRQSWNTANPTKPADVIIGVVPKAKSGGPLSCAHAFASLASPEAWIRLMPHVSDSDPAVSGSLAGIETAHMMAAVPTVRDRIGDTYHSPYQAADLATPNRAYNVPLRKYVSADRTVMYLYVDSRGAKDSLWKNDSTFLEPADFDLIACQLGGATNTECGASGTTGTTVGVAAGFVISGVTDGQTSDVLESYFAGKVPHTKLQAGSPLVIRELRANGTELASYPIPVSFTESHHHGGADDTEHTTKALFSAAVPFNDQVEAVEVLYEGKRVYHRQRQATAPDITSLTTAEPGEVIDYSGGLQPALSGDGEWVAWTIPTEAGPAVHVAPITDSTDLVGLADPEGGPLVSAEPAWCGDGSKLAYVVGGDVYSVSVDTAESPVAFGTPALVYDAGGDAELPPASHPTWSPDCSQIAFAAQKNIWKVGATGTGQTQLTNTGDAGAPSWSQTPGDNRIAYTRETTGTYDGTDCTSEICLRNYVAPEGGEQFSLASHEGGAHYLVTNTADSGPGSLRKAMEDANLSVGLDVIEFDISNPDTPGAVYTITPETRLPTITDPVTIDATTQAGWSADTPRVVIDGSVASGSNEVPTDGLTVAAGQTTIKGLVINRFNGHGIRLSGNGNNSVLQSFIGTDPTGMSATDSAGRPVGNGRNGIYIHSGSDHNSIGSVVAGTGNVISGNAGVGVRIEGGGDNNINRNMIGTNKLGTAALPNQQGIRIYLSARNTIGGMSNTESFGNVISGNTAEGVAIGTGAATTSNYVYGNKIGTSKDGSAAIGNNVGVRITDSSDNEIGTTNALARNVIAGNGFGIWIEDTTSDGDPAIGNTIRGNYVGRTAATEVAALRNVRGVVIETGGTIIGGTAPSARNVISGNQADGILLNGAGATENIVRGNYIGTDPTGDGGVPNGANGIFIAGGSGNVIGGLEAGQGNLISGNANDGIQINGNRNRVQGNLIGTNAAGSGNLGNAGHGVGLHSSSTDNWVGGSEAGAGNTIAFNGRSGIDLFWNASGTAPKGNRFLANSIHSNVRTDGSALGIDIVQIGAGGTGVTPNDAGDADTGANDLQNFPVLTAATSGGGSTTISGTLNSKPNTVYRLDYYSNASCDPSGYGEGERFLGTASVTTDGSGNATFASTYPVDVAVGRQMTATATEDPVATGNSSEFSQCRAVTAADLPSFVVNSTNDAVDLAGCTVSHCSLREAIQRANTNAGTDTITFDIPGASHTISPSSALPAITQPVIIDGTTEPNFTSCAAGPVVEISGAAASTTEPNGLLITGGGSTVKGLVINRFNHFDKGAIRLQGGTGNTVQCNYLGTNAAGTAAAVPGTNLGVGVEVEHSSNNTIGGTTAEARNVISGNGAGIRLDGSSAGNKIQGNYIGTNAAGTAAVGNYYEGVYLNGTSNNDVGGAAAGAGNVISGNRQSGVAVNGASGNKIEGNLIGTDKTGSADLGNGSAGVVLGAGSTGTTIGGTSAAARNIISGNGGAGVNIAGGVAPTTGNTVQGNHIGTTADGKLALENDRGGVVIASASNNLIGGSSGGARNVIAGNRRAGVTIANTTSTANRVQGNYIGLNADGAPLANTFGVQIWSGANQNLIGGETSGTGNVISGNTEDGIEIVGVPPTGEGAPTLTHSNSIAGNRIGTNAAGTAAVANGGHGVEIQQYGMNNVVGSSIPGWGNLIGGNTGSGVRVQGASSTGNSIWHNWIGIGTDLGTDLGNDGAGVLLGSGSDRTLVGRMNADGVAVEPNNIAFNGGDGISVEGGANQQIRGNSIHSNGQLGIDLGSVPAATDGVTANDAGDADTGPNGLQNHPVVTFAQANGATTTISGNLDSLPSRSYDVDLYSNPGCDPSSHGEGKVYLGRTTITTGADGKALFTKTAPSSSAQAGSYITATANLEDVENPAHSSEFSACLLVASAATGSELWVLDPTKAATDTASKTRLIGNASAPSWGESGSIAFVRDGAVWTVKSDGTGAATIPNTGPGALWPALGGSSMAFYRLEEGEARVKVLHSTTVVEVRAAAHPTPLTFDLILGCEGKNFPALVGARGDSVLADGTTRLVYSLDDSTSCGNSAATLTAVPLDGLSLYDMSDPDASIFMDIERKSPTAAALRVGQVLAFAPIAGDGSIEDPEDGELGDEPGEPVPTWTLSGPNGFTRTGQGRHFDFAPPANGWPIPAGADTATYTLKLEGQDLDGNTASTSQTILVQRDDDHDNLWSRIDKLSCVGAVPSGTTGDNDPSNQDADPDGDGLRNVEDRFTDGGICVAHSDFEAIADFTPDPFKITSSGTIVTFKLRVSNKNMSQIDSASVKIVEVAGYPVTVKNVYWSISNGVATAKFDVTRIGSEELKVWMERRHLIGQRVTVHVIGASKAGVSPAWNFKGVDSTLVLRG